MIDILNHPNIDIVNANMSNEFIEKISKADIIMLVSEIFSTGAINYKIIREILQKQNKNIIYDVLL